MSEFIEMLEVRARDLAAVYGTTVEAELAKLIAALDVSQHPEWDWPDPPPQCT